MDLWTILTTYWAKNCTIETIYGSEVEEKMEISGPKNVHYWLYFTFSLIKNLENVAILGP
jgi:hypothetical protein